MDRFVLRIFFFFFQCVKINENSSGDSSITMGYYLICRIRSVEMFNFITIPSDISLSWEYPSFQRNERRTDCLVSSRGYRAFRFFREHGRTIIIIIRHEAYTIKNFNKSAIVLGSIQLEAKNFLTIS